MSESEKTFVEKCLAGDALAENVDDYVHRWHSGEGDPNTSLDDFLGFTQLEYRLWTEKPHLLSSILDARRTGIPLVAGIPGERPRSLATRVFMPMLRKN